MILFSNIAEAITLKGVAKKDGRKPDEKDLSIEKNISMLSERGKIVWMGKLHKLPKVFKRTIKKEISLDKRSILPAFVECHTHLVHAGERADEFEMCNNGITYSEIAKRGGGILSTVKSTRKASLETLSELAQKRADLFLSQGVSTIEVKSGYGLRLKDELKMLQAAKNIKKARVVTTYLGPHAKAPEDKNINDSLERIIEKDLLKLKASQLADRVDIFIEEGFFAKELSQKYLEKAKEIGFNLTIHADQISRTGSGVLGVQLEAQSVDHLVQINKSDIKKIASSNTTAVLLPAADYYLKMKYPPARALLDAGAKVALATDFNPGSSPTQDLAFVGLLARMEMQMSLPEVLASYTYNAASALGLEESAGSLEVGKYCDFSVLDASWSELFYHVGHMPIQSLCIKGKKVFSN